MTASVYITSAGTVPTSAEIELIEHMRDAHGRVTLLVPSYREGEVCRRTLADAGVGTGVDVLTPAAWVAGLWELFGDGRQPVSQLQRRLLTAQMLAVVEAQDPASLAPLKNNPGSVEMLVGMACDCYPYACSDQVDVHALSRAERRSIELLARYGRLLGTHGLIEPSAMAVNLRAQLASQAPACARAVAVRGVTQLPMYLLDLLGAVGERGSLAFMYGEHHDTLAQHLADMFKVAPQRMDGTVPQVPAPSFAEVCGPTARIASYARLVEELADTCPDGGVVAVCAPDPLALLRDLGPRLAARGIAVQAEDFRSFDTTRAGQMFFQLLDVLDRMNTRERSAWWPAPDIVDWVRSPFSGIGPFARHVATALDTQLRKNRMLTKETLLSQLESMQSRELNRARARAEKQGSAVAPVVVKDVLDALDAGRYARVLQLMQSAAEGASPSDFGAEGFAAQRSELAALHAASEVFEQARALGVDGDAALMALRHLSVRVGFAPAPAGARPDAEGAAHPTVQIMTMNRLAEHEAVSFDAVLLVDMDAECYPLIERDTATSLLADKLGCAGAHAAPAACQRDRTCRCLQAARRDAVLAYVCRDNAAEERFPALAYAELRAAAESGGALELVGGLPTEQELFANCDAAGGEPARLDDAPRGAEHMLPDDLASYVLLSQRSVGGSAVTRTLSASQVENYLACPYRWFVNSRVPTRRLDVEFGPIERGNFSHDVMQRFYERLAECGLKRVTPGNVERCHEEMDRAFDEVRDDHALGRYTHGKYAGEERPRSIRGGLVPLDELERTRLEAMRAQFHAAVEHDATMLSIYEPAHLEYSFDKQGVTYAGRPLGGRIDRVDVAPSAGSGERFVVIDYKTGNTASTMECPDPTMNVEEGEPLAEDWLPGRDKDKAPKVQALMYASALERMTGGSAQGAVYYGLRATSIAGAVSSALTECEPPAFPDDTPSPFPGVKGKKRVKRDGEMEFPDLLAQVEHAISLELDRLQAGEIAPRPASDSCSFCPLTMCEKRR